MSRTEDLLLVTVRSLIDEGQHVLATEFDASGGMTYIGASPRGVNLQDFAKWSAGCINLIRMLGQAGECWKDAFSSQKNSAGNATRMLGTLEAIETAIEQGLLVRIEDLVFADAFDDLLEQADHLQLQGYFVAAGVLGRAVLEGHLRAWCERVCDPSMNPRPTLSTFTGMLYKEKHINVTVMKHIESMAAVGNDAAHNKTSLQASDVARLLRDVRDFMARHP